MNPGIAPIAADCLPGTDRTASDTNWFDAMARPLTQLAFRHLDGLDGDILALDLGCGRGERTVSWDEKSRVRWVGIDIDAESLHFAKAHSGERVLVRGDVERLPFRDSSFDAIFSFSVLQYVNWESVVTACCHLLRPGGRAVFIENLSANPFAAGYRLLHRLAGWKYSAAQTPRCHLRWKELPAFGRIFGDAEVSVSYLMTPCILILPALANRITGSTLRTGPPWLLRALRNLDWLLLKQLPCLRQFCWLAVVLANKRGA